MSFIGHHVTMSIGNVSTNVGPCITNALCTCASICELFITMGISSIIYPRPPQKPCVCYCSSYRARSWSLHVSISFLIHTPAWPPSPTGHGKLTCYSSLEYSSSVSPLSICFSMPVDGLWNHRSNKPWPAWLCSLRSAWLSAGSVRLPSQCTYITVSCVCGWR